MHRFGEKLARRCRVPQVAARRLRGPTTAGIGGSRGARRRSRRWGSRGRGRERERERDRVGVGLGEVFSPAG